MGRNHSALGSVQILADGICCKLCPVTCGRPTKMLKATFKKLCDHHRNEQRESAISNYNWKKGQKKSWCGECKGQLPPELEIINKGELIAMAGIKDRGTCESCKNKNVTIGNNYGLKMCSSCAAVFSAVNNRFPVVAEAVKRTGRTEEAQKLFGSVVEFAPVTVESTALEEIAAAVGYTGTDGDGLIDEVRRLAQIAASGFSVNKTVSADVIMALDCEEAKWELAAIQSAAYMGKYRRELKASELLIDHIADVVSYPGKEAGTLPEFVTRVWQDFSNQLADLLSAAAKIKDAIGLSIEVDPKTVAISVSLMSQSLDQYMTRCEESAARAREHEQLASYREQLLLACKDALGMPLISVGDLPRVIEEKLLELDLWSSAPVVAPGPSVLTPIITALDSHLLDLALECMRGEITGLDPDRIALLRDAV
jgi:hypothetical protein